MAKFNEEAMAALEEIVNRFGDDPEWIGERVGKIKTGLVDEFDESKYMPMEKYQNLMKAYTHILMGINDIVVDGVEGTETKEEKKPEKEPEEINSIEDLFDD